MVVKAKETVKTVEIEVAMLEVRPESNQELINAILNVSNRAVWIESETHTKDGIRLIKMVAVVEVVMAGTGFEDDQVQYQTKGFWVRNGKLTLHSIVNAPTGIDLHVQAQIRSFDKPNGKYINLVNSVMSVDDLKRIESKIADVNNQTTVKKVWFGKLYTVQPDANQLQDIENFIIEHDVDNKLRDSFNLTCSMAGFDFSQQASNNGIQL
jgi:hypothetical protein